MSIVDRYVCVLSALVLGTSVVFAWTGETRLDLCLSVYIIETLALNQLFVWLSDSARKSLAWVERVLGLCFAVIVVAEIVRIIAG
ncbi:MAG: hypothetical protein KAQ74_01315 [Dehalococcoidia bacterium]|nr:hypothetical protein [Dehalococcoidia bacterium]